jgi:aspartyl-tRNA(Asn)/glutamyl-tRNA(Gln) amidotransferase subunit B
MSWQTVIGLEAHIQLDTNTKLFSATPCQISAPANTLASAIDLGLPGTLPTINRSAVNMALKFGLAIGADIANYAVFERKNYFYPDLPKGYQITQHRHPLSKNGQVTILDHSEPLIIAITQAHLEEDSGKSFHSESTRLTHIDHNRAGIPLLEVVSTPTLHDAEVAVAYLKTLQTLVRYLGISQANPEQGSLRCDVNVSVRRHGTLALGPRTEIKNLNSFHHLKKAINYEVKRQITHLEAGGTLHPQTRLFNSKTGATHTMRAKVSAQDYRYFPDPDLPPCPLSPHDINSLRNSLPELPEAKVARYQHQFKLSRATALQLARHPELAHYFETTVQHTQATPTVTAKWIINDLLGALQKSHLSIANSPISAHQLAQILDRLSDNTLSSKLAKKIFSIIWHEGGEADKIIRDRDWAQITDSVHISTIIDKVIRHNPEQISAYQAGQDKLLAYLVGLVLEQSEGKANPTQVKQLLTKRLRQKL